MPSGVYVFWASAEGARILRTGLVLVALYLEKGQKNVWNEEYQKMHAQLTLSECHFHIRDPPPPDLINVYLPLFLFPSCMHPF